MSAPIRFVGRFRPRHSLIAAALMLANAPADALWNGVTRAPYEVSAELGFDLDIGRFLFLQVGSAGALIDTVRFDIADSLSRSGPDVLGTGQPLDALQNGALGIVLRSNAGTVSLSATHDGIGVGLANGLGQFLSYDQILTESSDSGLPAPGLTNTGATTVTVAPTGHAGRVTDRQALWTYRFANKVVPPPGLYRGEVTYTAAVP